MVSCVGGVSETAGVRTAGEHLTRVLEAMAGPGAVPRSGQVEAVDALLSGPGRVLVVQATGWGKSAVYWAATLAQREAGSGPTVVVSPLLALMRDQVAAAARIGLRAVTVNSSNIEEWDSVFEALERDEVDVLLVSPERLSNPAFEARALPLLRRAGLLVIDEAHCISDWGHDFRPDYQRVAQLLTHLESSAPVLATTATANRRVTGDVAGQLGTGTLVLRGPLARSSLQLAVVPRLNAIERFAWVHEALERLPGSGIVYGLTVDQVETLAGFLAAQGHRVAAYTGQLSAAEREAVEDDLRANRLKAVVATSALGMGYDKPDLSFCIHVGSPDSPVTYYQQVGRAGRALQDAAGVLLPAGESDPRIWEYFATASIPSTADALAVQGYLRQAGEPRSVPVIEAETGLRRGRLETLLKVLHVHGAVRREGRGWTSTGNGWVPDEEKYAKVVSARRAESDLMRSYAHGERCLMQVLTEALDDPESAPCRRCSVCTGGLPFPGASPSGGAMIAAGAYLRGREHIIEPRHRWPSGAARRGRIAGWEKARAVAYADDPAWPELVGELRSPDAAPSAELAGAVTDLAIAMDAESGPFSAVVPVPSRSHPTRVMGMAHAIAESLGVPALTVLSATGTGPYRDGSSAQRVEHLQSSLAVNGDAGLPTGSVLLVDDVVASRWTITVAAVLLREAGAVAVHALVGHHRAA